MAITNIVTNNFISDHYYVTVTEPGCVPVHENVVSKKYGFIHTRLVSLWYMTFNPVNKLMELALPTRENSEYNKFPRI